MSQILLSMLLAVGLFTNLFASEPEELCAAKEHFSLSPRSESERQQYITELAALREKFAKNEQTSDWQAVDAEIRQHPAPADSDSAALSRMLVGDWGSPRHEYSFRSNGTWALVPVETDTLHGSWRIEGNQYYDTVEIKPPETHRYTIILLNARDFIFTDGEHVFYDSRM